MLVVSLMRLGDEENRLKETFPEVDFEFYKHPSELPKTTQEKMDVLITYHAEVDEAFIEAASNLKWIAWYATGVNALPLQKIKEAGISLTNAKGVHAQQLTEFLYAFILDDYKELKEVYNEQKEKVYNSKRTTQSIEDQVIMFLGTGVIPQRAAEIAKAFNMKTIGLNTTGHKVENFDRTYSLDERQSVYKEADIVVNILPETKDTHYLLTKTDFEHMNDHTLFVNIGRGTIVEEAILVEVLKNKLIRKAYLDVFEQEPLDSDSKLYQLDNVYLTSHIAGNGETNKKKSTDIFINNFKNFLNKNELIENVVDLDKGY
ncbi:phosphoglycerate dehydrogenase [Staphylococcus canis]|uniref:Hydroxyacid dehydrogenase n=1 Tax=Staphylococcus canis TaxID=2724942 RepID=A0ABS0T808_9STAP|nr:phosphoglycerate dehydrogenase [Staphylococcus canis]MBI5974705.1 hydroxyacid dehydrogenase [Staphylococcus canis]